MTIASTAPPASRWIRFFTVLLAFFALWCVLIGIKAEDLVVGAFAALCGSLAAKALWPQRPVRLLPGRAIRFAAVFLRQSLLAGVDVAARVFAPSLPLAPGFVSFRPRLPGGFRRDFFVTLSSMMPGTLPVGRSGRDGLLIHCLDARRPVAADMEADEARFAAIFGEEHHG